MKDLTPRLLTPRVLGVLAYVEGLAIVLASMLAFQATELLSWWTAASFVIGFACESAVLVLLRAKRRAKELAVGGVFVVALLTVCQLGGVAFDVLPNFRFDSHTQMALAVVFAGATLAGALYSLFGRSGDHSEMDNLKPELDFQSAALSSSIQLSKLWLLALALVAVVLVALLLVIRP
jgi:hypothetical protein